ncbi:MAG: glutamine-hydrolyzing GMP synthase, partial [Candidatus Saganbacteria bacterium]|nr:glutamine-hydrolyzing GMP synthase [Candidatus Saganbacteria bacterium]
MSKHDLIVILDFGAQYSMLIARRVRECNVYSEIIPHDTPLEELKRRNVKGIIFSGGPSSVFDKGAPVCDPKILGSGIPILGICYGIQLMAVELGGDVKKAALREYGKADLIIDDNTDLFAGLGGNIQCWMSHGDSVTKLPEGFEMLAHTLSTPFAAIGNKKKKIYG